MQVCAMRVSSILAIGSAVTPCQERVSSNENGFLKNTLAMIMIMHAVIAEAELKPEGP